VEDGSIVEALTRQLLKILDCSWRGISPKLHHHFTFVSFDHSDFVWGTHQEEFLSFLRRQRPQCLNSAARRIENFMLTMTSMQCHVERSRLPSRSFMRSLEPSLDDQSEIPRLRSE
jgi:hypothetical protein